ncbi:histidine phosphatase superfamily branch 1 protein [Nitzschia inconspicua]|uniref:Histidine phosphatase superfamily branch 1 protein n=1 Tax=Nitzschia inconspicua TaxID=303405 RepID=A0A9K3LR18_9STRA|nr:histidine phosphatase superfamily branch 1 protein [Nitzschia inconspicua]
MRLLLRTIAAIYITSCSICKSAAFEVIQQHGATRILLGISHPVPCRWRHSTRSKKPYCLHGDYRRLAVSRIDDDGNESSLNCQQRRQFLQRFTTNLSTMATASTLFARSIATQPLAAHAMGLMKFPCTEPLHNTYHFIRAGTSLLEEQDIWSTNPLFLTNREAALSPLGRQQVLQAVRTMTENNIQPSQIRHSLAASAMDTAGMIRDELKVGQNRINPEFVFLDPRAIGAWEGMSLQSTQPAIVALDDGEAGIEGREGRPPPNDDGTPNETLFDQSTRLRQLMSALETQYSGDTILLVFPDGTGPALLSALMAGIPINRVHLLDYRPGELRMDVTRQSTLDLFRAKQQQEQESCAASIQRGEEELRRLRSLDMTTVVNKKDQLMEEERLAIENDYRQKQEAQRQKQEAADQARLVRQREIEEKRRKRQDEAEQLRLSKQPQIAKDNDGMPSTPNDPKVSISGILAGFVIGGVSLLAFGTNDEEQRENMKVSQSNQSSNTAVIFPETAIEQLDPLNTNGNATETDQERRSGLHESQVQPSSFTPPQRAPTEVDRNNAARVAMEEYLNQDDGGDNWLQMMIQLRDDDEDDEDNDMPMDKEVPEAILATEDDDDRLAADALKDEHNSTNSSSWEKQYDDLEKWQ